MSVIPLLKWSELPAWRQDNHFIHAYYRETSNSFLISLQSLTYLHNETVNIYTHFVGSLAFMCISVPLYLALAPRYGSAATGDVLAFSCFFAGAALCLGMSGSYHLIANHSPRVNKIGNKLDYVGIVFLIAGSYAPSIYYGFYCHPELQVKYWVTVC